MNEQLKVTDLRVGYRNRDVVQNISFTVNEGELCALMGRNGAGKSTLLRAICGLLPATGCCTLKGEALWQLSQRERAKRIGYLAQRGGVALSLSALDVVLMGFNPELGLFQEPSRTQRTDALALMEEFETAQLADRDFLTLSEGQRQMVLFVRTLVRRPGLLILDEPDSALDYPNRHRLMKGLREYAGKNGAEVLLCSHDANLSLEYADRLLLLEKGRLYRNIRVAETTELELNKALSHLFGPVELLRHKNAYLMTEGGQA